MTDSLYVKTARGILPIAIEGTGGGGVTRKIVTSNSREAVLTAGTAWTVPQHTVDSNELAVYIEGLLCTRGVEYTDASSTTITFTSDIPATFSLAAEVVN